MRQQFVLAGRQLPKALIYGLLPDAEGLPKRFTPHECLTHIIDLLASYLVSLLKKAPRESRHVVNR